VSRSQTLQKRNNYFRIVRIAKFYCFVLIYLDRLNEFVVNAQI